MVSRTMKSVFGREWPGGRIGEGFAIPLVLAALVVAVATFQSIDGPKPQVPVYVQSILLTDIPVSAAPYFSISNLPDGLANAGFEDGTAIANEEEATPIGDGQRQLTQQLTRSGSREGTIVLAGGQRLLDIDYDLNVEGRRAGDLEIAKTVTLNGARMGTVNFTIDQNSQLHISTVDLSRILPQNIRSRIRADGDYVTFDSLRSSGLDIRYDPVSDTLKINS